MEIDYIRVFQLNWDCNTDEIISCQTDLNNFDYAVKRSISITPTSGEITIGCNEKVTYRVSNSFEATGPFTIENGAEFTVIKQECPEPNN